MTGVRPRACAACPYRQDAPPGVWAPEEYDKLLPYDEPTGYQPFNGFACHSATELYCHGWAVCHSNRGGEFELLALRLRPAEVPAASVPLFDSAAEAAERGQQGKDERAEKAIDKLERLPWLACLPDDDS